MDQKSAHDSRVGSAESFPDHSITPTTLQSRLPHDPVTRARGRAAKSNASGRFEKASREIVDDGWGYAEEAKPLRTNIHHENIKSIISRNDSPDISFDQSINPYRGCEHGCIYCYARPSHAYLGHSPGLDFETELYAKTDAAQVLEKELADPAYVCKTTALGANTDPYQPIEDRHEITREILQVLARTKHPVGIVTKSASIVRDIDILAPMARDGLVKVALSITTLNRKLARTMEPRAATPAKRLAAVQALSDAGIPTSVMVAPIIPGLTDHEMDAILQRAAQAGAREAGYVVLRMPHEIKQLFREWLEDEQPDRAKRVISLLQSMHAGRDYRSRFGVRQTGSGPFADLIARRFRLALKRHNLDRRRLQLRTDLFERPTRVGGQFELTL
ncbi:MAG: PA0069 family radical SAM protein [Pseudomonadota bacterium]